MTTEPLVSVVVATNRNGPYLRATLASLAAQTYPNWELILVEDGAPDPAAIEAAVACVPGAVIVHQTNAGVSVARNVAFFRSTGTYVAFLDDDDTWEPERLSRQVASLEGRPGAAASYCQLDVIDEHDITIASGDLVSGDTRSILRNETATPIPTLLIARWALERVGLFHPMLPPGEDIDLIYRLARTGEFVFVPDVLVHYRRHAANESGDLRGAALASRRALWIQQWWATRKNEAEVMEDLGVGLHNSRHYWTDRLVRAAVHEARKGKLTLAGRYAAFVALHDPGLGLTSVARIARGRKVASSGIEVTEDSSTDEAR